jgi:uncharacterized protein (DUF1778 family)
MSTKTGQLQIRVSAAEKAALKRLARAAGQDVSSYVLSLSLPAAPARFQECVRALARVPDHRFVLAELNELLAGSSRAELSVAVAAAPSALGGLSDFLQNYVAAMVEQACHQRDVPPPAWTRGVPPLAVPYFPTTLRSLRPHLLRAAPVPFKRRNLFVDASVGDRV